LIGLRHAWRLSRLASGIKCSASEGKFDYDFWIMETKAHPMPSPPRRLWLPWLLMGVLALAAVGELTQCVANRRAAQAAVALDANQPALARQQAERALAWNASHARANFTRVMALRALQQPGVVATAAEALAQWHPQRALLLLIAGEAQLTLNHPAEAARNLWAGLWAGPIPRDNPAAFWRNAWQASAQAGGAASGPARAARNMATALLPRDTRLTPAQRDELERELQTAPHP
jgi:hypothetical protein